ncbi:hypothetical protein LWI29_032974 [Acer saccharum]|uniref:Uncharacterized protein n=1 Tax=Acer saccharum TaxID=4024 RepID=A0AA39SMU8_ACESA|nr:hypothetical protein LWI29_032974 [Acer saccharum]
MRKVEANPTGGFYKNKGGQSFAEVVKEVHSRGIRMFWSFQSMKDRDAFIRNKMLWRDFFSSVGVWSAAITPQARLAWVEFRGVPLDCWCEDFSKDWDGL